jgi:hypothetical protein
MSEVRQVTLASTSNAEDAAWLAVADVAAVATDLGIDYRLIGGNSVALLVRVHDAAAQVPERATADADMGVSFEVCADPRLMPALTVLGYERQSGNRFIRTLGTRALVIDVLAPSYLGRLRSNRPHGDLVVDEIPGLLDALRLPPVHVAARAILTDTTQVDVRVPLPDVRAALVMKAHAYAGRLGDNDALDIWRLLQSAANAGHVAGDWPRGSTARDAAVLLHRHFGAPSSGGPRRATPNRTNQARIRALVANIIPNPTRN